MCNEEKKTKLIKYLPISRVDLNFEFSFSVSDRKKLGGSKDNFAMCVKY